MNPQVLAFLRMLYQRLQGMQQQPQHNQGALANYQRGQELMRGRPTSGMPGGRFFNEANQGGTLLAQQARQWLMNNQFYSNPGGSPGLSNPTPGGGNQYGTVLTNNGQVVGPAMGMGNQLNSFGYREVDPNAQLNQMDAYFTGAGRSPDAGAGGDWGFGSSGGTAGVPQLF